MVGEPEDRVVEIVNAAGGRLVSRVRLQKIAYLLDRLGAVSGFHFSYHHYGPYSRDLDTAVLDAEAFGKLRETFDRRQTDGARYSIFEVNQAEGADRFVYLSDEALRARARELAAENVTVLELAATAHWLLNEERVGDWKSEIVRRKGPKTRNGRLAEAVRLLAQVGLEPATL